MYSNLENNTSNNNEQFMHALKVILVGDAAVGKTSLLSKYVKGIFPQNPQNTIALEFCTKIMSLKDGTKVKVQLFDTAGQEKYRSVISNYYRKSLGALLVFDLTRKETFVILQKFLTDIRQFAEPDCVIFLIGNKLDLVQGNENLRQVSSEEAKTFANENQLYYMETSACSNYKVTEAFETLIEKVYNEKIKTVTYMQKIENIDISKRRTASPNSDQGGCCS